MYTSRSNILGAENSTGILRSSPSVFVAATQRNLISTLYKCQHTVGLGIHIQLCAYAAFTSMRGSREGRGGGVRRGPEGGSGESISPTCKIQIFLNLKKLHLTPLWRIQITVGQPQPMEKI